MYKIKDASEQRRASSVVHLFWDSATSILANPHAAQQSLPGPELLGVLSAVKANMRAQLFLVNELLEHLLEDLLTCTLPTLFVLCPQQR